VPTPSVEPRTRPLELFLQLRKTYGLVENTRRNRVIADTYVRPAATLGKTTVFACNIDHAVALANFLGERGLAARWVYHRQPDDERYHAICDFRLGRVQVLVNVQLLTHGSDIPDVCFSFSVGRR